MILTDKQLETLLQYKKEGHCIMECGRCILKDECDLISSKYELLTDETFLIKDIVVYIMREFLTPEPCRFRL